MSSRKRTPAIGLPNGWVREETVRQSGLSRGKSDVYYFRYGSVESFVPVILHSRFKISFLAAWLSETAYGSSLIKTQTDFNQHELVAGDSQSTIQYNFQLISTVTDSLLILDLSCFNSVISGTPIWESNWENVINTAPKLFPF